MRPRRSTSRRRTITGTAAALVAAAVTWALVEAGTAARSGALPDGGDADGIVGPNDRRRGSDERPTPESETLAGPHLRAAPRPSLPGPAAARRELVRLLRGEPIDWKAVAEVLAVLEGPVDPEVRSVLLAELRVGRRNLALVAFEALHDRTFVADLFALLDEPETPAPVTRVVLKALSGMPGANPDEVARRLGARLHGAVKSDADLLAAIARRGGTEAVRVLVAYVRRVDDPARIPQNVLAGLTVRGDAAAENAVLDALAGESSAAALAALLAMISVPGATRFTDALIDLDRGTRAGPVREPLRSALGCIGGDLAVTYLLERAGSVGKEGAIAARALGCVRFGDEKTASRLEQALAAADAAPHAEDLKRSLLRALGALGYESSLPRIVERLKASSIEIRRESVRALGRLGVGARGEVETLRDLFLRGDPSLRASVVTALGLIGGSDALGVLETISAMEDLPPSLRTALRQGLQAPRGESTPSPRER